MLNIEVAEIMKDPVAMFDIAEKTNYKLNLNAEEKETSELLDAWVKEVADKGDPNREISAFIRKTLQSEVYEAPDELLDLLFTRGSVGEFDDYEIIGMPKNTLVSYEAAKGGTVDTSYLDITHLRPTWKNRQVDFEMSFVDLRRNGWKTVATYTANAKEALQNALFADIFGVVDAAITGGDQLIPEATAKPTQASIDALALYLNDRGNDGVMVGLTKYAQAIARMEGHNAFMSENMKNDFNRYGLVNFIQGVNVAGISGAKKMGNGELLIPDKRLFGIAGKIGTLDMKGDIHVYQDMDNASESVRVYVKDFTYGYAITDIDNAAKIVFAK